MISAPLGCGFAAFRTESLRLSVTSLQKERLRLGRRSRQTGQGLTESQRLSAREAAKPQNQSRRNDFSCSGDNPTIKQLPSS